MIVKGLGILDLIAAILVFVYLKSNFLPQKVLIIIGIYLFIKGAIFLIGKDFASALDIISGVIILLVAYYSVPNVIVYIVIFYLVQKGVISLL